MATAVAYKDEFLVQADAPLAQEEAVQPIDYSIRQDNVGPLRAASPSQMHDLLAAGQSGSFDQGVDPQIYRASSGLIQRDSAGFPVNIEAYGYPFDVLENVAAQLEAMGASQYVTAQVMGALKDYIINMGSEFSRAAKAKPLYVRIMVTDREPDDLPECEQTQAVFLDGVRKIGGEAARINVQNTVFGTKSTTSQGVDLNAMFSSKIKGLFVFFGAPTNEGIGGFDSVDAALVNLAQGMGGGAGGGATQQAIEEIKQAIKNGEATPQTLKLIENLAALAALADAIKTPGAVANAPTQMAEIVRAITQQIQTGVAEGTIPAAVLQGTATVIANLQGNDLVQAILASPEGAQKMIVAADNDNAAPVAAKPDNDNATIVKQIETITAQLTELAAVQTTPPELRAQIEAQIAQITKAMDAPQGAEMQAVLVSVAQTLSTIDVPAAEAIVAKIDVATVQIAAAQAVEAPAITAAVPLTQLPEIAELAAADIKELIAVLQKADALPPALAEAVQKIDLQNMTPEKIAEALQGKGESAPAVQAMIVALANPAVQAQLPAQTLVSVNEFVARQPEVIPTVTTQVAVQTLDTIAASVGVNTPAGAEITTVTQTLKDGTQTVATLTVPAADTVNTALADANPAVATALRGVADVTPVGGGVPNPPPAPLPGQPPVDFKQPDITPTPTPTPVAPPTTPAVDVAPPPAPVQPPAPVAPPVDVAPVQPAPVPPPAPGPVGGPQPVPPPQPSNPPPVNPPTNVGPQPVTGTPVNPPATNSQPNPPPAPAGGGNAPPQPVDPTPAQPPIDLKQPFNPPPPPKQDPNTPPQDKKPDLPPKENPPKENPQQEKAKPAEDRQNPREQDRQPDRHPAEDPWAKPEDIKYKQPDNTNKPPPFALPEIASPGGGGGPSGGGNPQRVGNPEDPNNKNEPPKKDAGDGCDVCPIKRCAECGANFNAVAAADAVDRFFNNDNNPEAAAPSTAPVYGIR